MNCHPQIADALFAESDGCRQHEIGAVRFQQIRRAHIGAKSLGDERDYVHQRFRRLPLLRREVCYLFQGQDVPDLV